MVSRINKISFIKGLWGVMALVLFNMSIDPPDTTFPNLKEDLGINDQESIIELVLETFLGYENAINEHEDGDQDESNKKASKRIDLKTFSKQSVSQQLKLIGYNQLIYHPYQAKKHISFSFIDTPPPENVRALCV